MNPDLRKFQIFLVWATLSIVDADKNKDENKLSSQKSEKLHSWVVGLSNGTGLICGGALISDRHVLTAAHCFYDTKYSNNWFRFGKPNWIRYTIIGENDRSDPTDGQIFVKIQNYTLHPKWKPNRFPSYDFAIITLDRKIKFSKRVQAAKLPTSKTLNKSKMCKRYSKRNETTWLQTAGWGTLEPKKNAARRISSKVVRSLKVKCLPDSSCRYRFGDFNGSIMICLSNPDSRNKFGVCSGDSGSPLTISGVNSNGNNNDEDERATILGVVSGGYKSCKGMAVCGDVTSVLSWIKRSIK